MARDQTVTRGKFPAREVGESAHATRTGGGARGFSCRGTLRTRGSNVFIATGISWLLFAAAAVRSTERERERSAHRNRRPDAIHPSVRA